MSSPNLKKGPRGGVYYERNGRKIYVPLPSEEDYQERRSSQPTAGWSKIAPKKGRERARLYNECGSSCFLNPKSENPGQSGFPICPACRDPDVPCSCEPICKGIISAYVRARQWDHEEEAEMAQSLRDKYNCDNDEDTDDDSNQSGGMNELPGLLYESRGRFSQRYCPQPPPCPPSKPVKYKMRKREDDYCCRKAPTKRVGPQKSNRNRR